MTYDWHGPWDQNPSHHSPLYGTEGTVRIELLELSQTNTKEKLTSFKHFFKNKTLSLYIKGGISPSKLNLGLAFYGIKFMSFREF